MPIILGPGGAPFDPPALSPTLADCERELARRTGPYRDYTAGAGSTVAFARIDALASRIEQAPLAGLWLVRRGLYADLSPVVGFDPGDRARVISTQVTTAGAAGLGVDRDWAVPPLPNEPLEVVALDPVLSLRRAIRRGLQRSMVEERAAVEVPAYAAERDLTAALWWLANPRQVLEVLGGPSDRTWPPVGVPFESYLAGGHVWVRLAADVAPGTLWVRALRPRSSRTN